MEDCHTLAIGAAMIGEYIVRIERDYVISIGWTRLLRAATLLRREISIALILCLLSCSSAGGCQHVAAAHVIVNVTLFGRHTMPSTFTPRHNLVAVINARIPRYCCYGFSDEQVVITLMAIRLRADG